MFEIRQSTICHQRLLVNVSFLLLKYITFIGLISAENKASHGTTQSQAGLQNGGCLEIGPVTPNFFNAKKYGFRKNEATLNLNSGLSIHYHSFSILNHPASLGWNHQMMINPIFFGFSPLDRRSHGVVVPPMFWCCCLTWIPWAAEGWGKKIHRWRQQPKGRGVWLSSRDVQRTSSEPFIWNTIAVEIRDFYLIQVGLYPIPWLAIKSTG